MDEKSFGPNHRKVGGDLNPLTELLIADERYGEEANPLSKRARIKIGNGLRRQTS